MCFPGEVALLFVNHLYCLLVFVNHLSCLFVVSVKQKNSVFELTFGSSTEYVHTYYTLLGALLSLVPRSDLGCDTLRRCGDVSRHFATNV